VSPVTYALGFYIAEDILHSHRRENLKSYNEGHVTANEKCRKRENKTTDVTDLGALLSCETLRLSHCLVNRFVAGG
jgi:hypothetical protein